MPRITIAAALAMLLLLAPVASARPIDAGYPADPTTEVASKPKVMPERISDHPLVPAADDIKHALAQEESYSTSGNPDVAALVREQESTSGSGNQGPATASAPAPASDGDDAPWALIGGFVGLAVLFGLAVLLVARPRRPRVAT